jgi:hypothetical protein
VLRQALTQGWSVTRFQQAVEGTHWWKTNSATAREMVALSIADPAEYQSRIRNAEQQLGLQARQMGINDLPNLAGLALNSIVNNWTQAQTARALGQYYNINAAPQGQGAQIYQQLQQTYNDYGVPYSQLSLQRGVQKILEGMTTADTYTQTAINAAKGLYPGAAAQISQGMTVKDIADPYVQTYANTLEVDPNSINWRQDPQITAALRGQLSETSKGPTEGTMPLYQFQTNLRQDPRWQYTQNARDTMSTALMQLGKTFGFQGF